MLGTLIWILICHISLYLIFRVFKVIGVNGFNQFWMKDPIYLYNILVKSNNTIFGFFLLGTVENFL